MPLSRFREQFHIDESAAYRRLVLSSNADAEELGCALFLPLLEHTTTTTSNDAEGDASLVQSFDSLVARINVEPRDLCRLLLSAWLGAWNSRPWRFVPQMLQLFEMIGELDEAHDLLAPTTIEQPLWTRFVGVEAGYSPFFRFPAPIRAPRYFSCSSLARRSCAKISNNRRAAKYSRRSTTRRLGSS